MCLEKCPGSHLESSETQKGRRKEAGPWGQGSRCEGAMPLHFYNSTNSNRCELCVSAMEATGRICKGSLLAKGIEENLTLSGWKSEWPYRFSERKIMSHLHFVWFLGRQQLHTLQSLVWRGAAQCCTSECNPFSKLPRLRARYSTVSSALLCFT